MSEDNQAGCSDTSCCPPKTPITRVAPKVGRNDPCICGNGRKFKKCCGKNL
ncbi:MAG: SEC-C metal-binding domain-containing protein [Porticoccaceae bacterium]